MSIGVYPLRRFWLLAFMLSALAACSSVVPDSPEACKFDKVTELPVRIDRFRHPTVTVEIDGQPLNLLLDTGSNSTIIFESALDRTGLRKDLRYHGVASGAGGLTALDAVRADVLKLGDITLRDEILAVAPFNLTQPGGDAIDGLLGFSTIGKYDIDLDLPHHRMTLYRARFCPNGRPPWDDAGRLVQRASTAPFDGRPYAPIAINGHTQLGLLDTGATSMFIARPAALASGVAEAEMAADQKLTISGASTAKVETIVHRFESLNFLGLAIEHPTLGVLPPGSSAAVVIGMPILASHRVWIPVQGRKIHVSLPMKPD